MTKPAKTKMTLFHCINALGEDTAFIPEGVDLSIIAVPCSGMTTDVFLLKAFESGADAVAVAVCPEGACRYTRGNLSAKKRVQRTKQILDSIGIEPERLSLHNVSHGDTTAVKKILTEKQTLIQTIGPNPAA